MKGISDKYGLSGIPNRAIYPTSKIAWYICLLVFSKSLRVSAIFLSYDVLKVIHIVYFLFCIKLIAGTLLIFIQKPISSGKKITQEQWWRIIQHAFFCNVVNCLWLFGLTLSGPLRSVLLYEHSSFIIIVVASAILTGAGGPMKVRGTVFFIIAISSLLLFDSDDNDAVISEHPEGQHHGFSHIFYFIISRTGLADHKGGVILLVITLCLNTLFSLVSRKLSVEIGGAKRLYAISSAISAALLLPIVICLHLIYELTLVPVTTLGASFCAIAVVMFVLDYYVDSVCIQRLEANYFSRHSTLSLMISAFAIHFITNSNFTNPMDVNISEEHQLSAGLIFSSVMFITAVYMLTVPVKAGSKGKFVGYSTSGLPLYTFSGESLQKTSQSVLLGIKNALKQVLDESDSRKIFYFLCINLVFTFVEMAYGIWTNSLGLLSDSFHMMFDCSALVMGLYAAIMTRWKPTPTFSYGYGRVEVLSGFINGLFLIVIAFFVFTEGLNRLFDPPEVKTERLLVVSVFGLLVNLTGIFAFHHGHSHGEGHHHSHQHHRSVGPAHGHGHGHGHGHSHAHNANMQGVFLHILADTLGSVGVIASSLLIENFGWLIADPICSLFISSLIFLSVLPLLKDSAAVLVLQMPNKFQKDISELVKKILALDGVVSYRNQHFWLHSSSQLAGSIHVQIQNDVGEQKILSQISTLFNDIDFTYFTIQIEKENYFHYLSGLNSKTIAMLTNNSNCTNLSNISHVIKAV